MKLYNKRMLIIGALLLGLLIIGGISFAYLRKTETQTSTNIITSLNCLDVSMISLDEPISLTNAFPISDAEGIHTTPFRFKIKNECDSPVNANINLESLLVANNSLSKSYVKASINEVGSSAQIVALSDSATEVEPTISGATSNELMEFTLLNNATKTFELRLWIDINTTVDQGLGKTYQSKIVITASPKQEAPDGWFTAPSTTLLGAIRDNSPKVGTWTTAGNQNSTTGYITVLSPNADQQAYYWTYGDGYIIESGNFSLTNPSTCVYSSCYTSLLGKYMVGNSVAANSDSTDTIKTTTGLTYVYKVIYAAPTEIKLERYQYLDRGTSESYRYWTVGTNAESASADSTAKYNLTGVSVIDYTNNYSDLIGKYLGISSSSTVSLSYVAASTPSTTMTTTNLSYLYQVVDATPTYIVYKSAVESSLGKTTDDYGTSYYYRGAVENNYVVFAGMCWRIVRIDGAGNIKLVLYNYNSGGVSNPCDSQYDATDAAFARYDSTTNGLAGKSAFNTNRDSNAYIGFMYGTPGSSTYEAEHANTNDSTILTNLKTWYDAKFSAAQKAQLADVIWCNDKSLNTNSSFNPLGSSYTPTNLGYNTEVTYYGAETRLTADNAGTKATTSKVSLVCPEAGSDGKLSKYTASDTSNGNGYLNGYKIGLLTADEIAFAGTAYTTGNSAYYLNENSDSAYWWSLSPGYYNGSYAYVWTVYSTGTLLLSYIHFNYRVRPAVSLVSTVSITSGTGTQSNPFVVQ